MADAHDADAAVMTREELAGFLRDLGIAIRPAVQAAVPAPGIVPPRVKSPGYDGKGDVEHFLRCFHEVAQHQGWDAQVMVLKMRESLTEEAAICAEYPDLAAMEASLRQKFGRTPLEARQLLRQLKHQPQDSLADLATEVRRLVNCGYPDLDGAGRAMVADENFRATLNDVGLKNMLLFTPDQNIDAMVRLGTEYFKNTKEGKEVRPNTRHLTVPEAAEVDPVQVAALQNQSNPPIDRNQLLNNQVLNKLDQLLQAMQMRGRATDGGQRRRERTTSKPVTCWQCGEEGHVRRHCPKAQPKQGNEDNPRV